MSTAVTHGHGTTHKMFEPIPRLVWCTIPLATNESPDVNRDDSCHFPLHVYLKPWHPCIPLPQTHYFVSKIGIAPCYPGSWVQMGDSALVSCLSWQNMPENVQFLGEHEVSHAQCCKHGAFQEPHFISTTLHVWRLKILVPFSNSVQILSRSHFRAFSVK